MLGYIIFWTFFQFCFLLQSIAFQVTGKNSFEKDKLFLLADDKSDVLILANLICLVTPHDMLGKEDMLGDVTGHTWQWPICLAARPNISSPTRQIT